MRIEYTVSQAVCAGLAKSEAIIRSMIANGEVAAIFERDKWIIPAVELERRRQGLPLDESRRRQIMGALLDDDGNVIPPRGGRLDPEAAA